MEYFLFPRDIFVGENFMTFEYAKREDTAVILDFIKELAQND